MYQLMQAVHLAGEMRASRHSTPPLEEIQSRQPLLRAVLVTVTRSAQPVLSFDGEGFPSDVGIGNVASQRRERLVFGSSLKQNTHHFS